MPHAFQAQKKNFSRPSFKCTDELRSVAGDVYAWVMQIGLVCIVYDYMAFPKSIQALTCQFIHVHKCMYVYI